MVREYLAELPDARRRQERELLADMLPALSTGERGAGGSDDDVDDPGGSSSGSSSSSWMSGSSTWSSSHASYLARDDAAEDAGVARNVHLLTDLAVTIVRTRLAANPSEFLVVDDAQFLDSLSWQLVMAIKRSLRRCFLLLAFRPGHQSSARAGELRDGAPTILPLGPLSEVNVSELIARRLGRPEGGWARAQAQLGPAFWSQVTAAKGHPLVVSEIIRLWRTRCRRVVSGPEDEAFAARRGAPPGAIDSGAPSSPGGAAASPQAGRACSPPGSPAAEPGVAEPGPLSSGHLLSWLQRSRLDGTSMNARLAVKAAAVIGESFSLALLARITSRELSGEQLAAARQELEDEEIWVCRERRTSFEPTGASSEVGHFTHATMRQNVLESLPDDRRVALHAAVLKALEEELQAAGSNEASASHRHHHHHGEHPHRLPTRQRSKSVILVAPILAVTRSTSICSADSSGVVGNFAIPAPELLSASVGGSFNSRNSRERDRLSGERAHVSSIPPPSYATLGYHAREAGEHIKAAAYYLASAKHSSLDICLRNGLLQQGIRYVEEGLQSLTLVNSGGGGGGGGDGDSFGGSAADASANELEQELRSVLGAMKVGSMGCVVGVGGRVFMRGPNQGVASE